MSLCARNRARQGRPARAHTGLTFFCQAARLNGLSSSQLARSLHTLCRAGAPRADPRAGGGGVSDTGRDPTGGGCSGSSVAQATATSCSRGAPPNTVPASSSSGFPAQVGAAPTLRSPTSPGAQGQNARLEFQGPTSASPSPNSQAAPSSLPTLGHSAKVRIPRYS